MDGKANLPALEDERDAVRRLFEVGDHGLAALDQRLVVEPLERAELREPVLADRPARVEEPPPLPPSDELGVELLRQDVDEAVSRVSGDSAAEREVVLAGLERALRARRARCAP